MNFRTRLSGRDVSVYGIKKEGYCNYDESTSISIDWEVVTEVREWGIKGIYVYAFNVAFETEVNWWEEDDAIETIDIIEVDTSTDDSWDVMSDIGDIEFGNGFSPQDCEIDIENKTITIIF
jgi:hypothetical protein|tara:strand:- start:2810 stop:3172 length:363 start_codon:yes stop_codon:yes gene_type:complete